MTENTFQHIETYSQLLLIFPLIIFVFNIFILLLWSLFYNSNSSSYNLKNNNKIIIIPMAYLILQLFLWYIFSWINCSNLTAVDDFSAIYEDSSSEDCLFYLKDYELYNPNSNYLFYIDNFSGFFHFTILFFTFLIILLSLNYIKINKIVFSTVISIEFFLLILFSIIGMFFMIISNDFIPLYISLEIFTLSLFCLAAFKHTQSSIESSLKYFIIGSWTSCLFLFGIADCYLLVGSTSFLNISNALSFNSTDIILSNYTDILYKTEFNSVRNYLGFSDWNMILSLCLILSSLIGKLGGAPFHFWLVDVYEGVATPVTAFFSIVTKIPLWAVLLKLNFIVFSKLNYIYVFLIMFFAIFSILIGSIGMYNQSSLKRIFAYSSINHVGLMLIGLLTGVDYYGNISIIFHLFLYSITLIGFFSIFINLIPFRILDSKDNENVYLSDYKGLYSRNPYLSSSFIILLFSIAGIPPFSGFFSKFILLLSALQYQLYFVTFIAILGTVISCYKYIQIIKIIIFDDLSQTSFFNFNLLSSFILVISLLISSTIIYPSFFKLYYTIISYLFL